MDSNITSMSLKASKKYVEERIRVGKEKAVTSAFSQAYHKLQAKQDKSQTRQLLELARRKVHGRINQWYIIVVISKAIEKITDKVWTDYFVTVNLPT